MRLPLDDYRLLAEMAALETAAVGKTVHMCELVREAVRLYYADNDRLRECFKRSRHRKKTKC